MASLEHTTRLLKEKTNQMEIDRIKRQELEALLHSQKMKAVGQLTGGLAHDFNNLLAVIIGSLELVEPDARDAPRLSRALKAAERGALLTQRLLAFFAQAGAASPGGGDGATTGEPQRADASFPAGDLKPGD